MFPRVAGDTEVAQSLRILLVAKNLDKVFIPSFDGLYDMWRTLDTRPGLAVLTPYTQVSPGEIRLLAGCRASLLETGLPAALPSALAAFLGLSAPDGTGSGALGFTGAFRVFATAQKSPQAPGVVRPACSRGFDWASLRAATTVRGVKVCPLTGGTLPMRLTNTSGERFLLSEADPAGIIRIVLFTALPGENPRPIGSHPLPERLDPGQGVDIGADFSILTRQPGIIGVALGVVAGQDVHFVLDRPLFTSNYLPRFTECWKRQGAP